MREHGTLLLLALGALTSFAGCGGEPAAKKEAPQAESELPTVLHHDFRGKPLPDGLRFVNLRVKEHMEFRPDGLQVHVPNTYLINPKAGLGVQTNFGLKGDFDSTLTFEDFQAETPPSGGGVHLGMYLHSLGKGDVQLSRAVRPGDKQGILWKWFYRPYLENMELRSETSGKLRLKRQGWTLYFMWAPGAQSNDFETIYQCDFGDSDIGHIVMNVNTSGASCDIKVRLIDWHIRGTLENAPSFKGSTERPKDLPQPPAVAPEKAGLAVALGVGLALTLAAAAILWLFVRRRRAGQTAGTTPVSPDDKVD
jgi:hypothetical protein